MVRKEIHFYGIVQGVGFRYRSQYAASSLGLTGWVTNEWDGSVTVQAQGSMEAIDRFVQMMKSERFIDIQDWEMKTVPVEEEERRFRVK